MIIKLRFNHDHNGSGFVWRLFIDNVEHLAKDVKIEGRIETLEEEIASGEKKWNVFCVAKEVKWLKNDTSAVVICEKEETIIIKNLIDTLDYSAKEIKNLRKQNELQAARIQGFDDALALVFTQPPQMLRSAAGEDAIYKIEKAIAETKL